jgi:hypothetical protein
LAKTCLLTTGIEKAAYDRGFATVCQRLQEDLLIPCGYPS